MDTSTQIQEFSSEKFIADVQTALEWNDARVTEVDSTHVDISESKALLKKYDKFFFYDCLDGSSVRQDILDECKELGYEVTVRVVCNQWRHMRHEYMIYVKTK